MADKGTLEELYALVQERLRNPKADSYTNKLLEDDELIYNKLREELSEIIDAAYENRMGDDKDSLSWEVADLLYHLIVLLAKKEVTISEVFSELERRRK